MSFLLAIDQGTTSTRAIVFDRAGRHRGSAQQELPQAYPASGWVEHDALRIWQDSLACARGAVCSYDAACYHIAPAAR